MLYVGMVGAGVWMKAPEVAGFAFLTIIPLGLLLGLRRELPIKEKLARVEAVWYAIPLIAFIVWAVGNPGQPLQHLLTAFSGLIFMVCFGFLIDHFLGAADKSQIDARVIAKPQECLARHMRAAGGLLGR